jgi:hypothetical protein
MRCSDANPLLFEDAAGTLTDDVRRDVAAHLAECAACTAEAEELRDLWQGLGSVPPEPSDPFERRRRFDAMLSAYEAGAASGGSRGRSLSSAVAWMWQPMVRPAWALAGAAAALLLGVAAGRQVATPVEAPVPSDLQVLREEVTDLRQMVSLSLLQQQSASERLKGVSWAAQLESGNGTVVAALLEALSNDPNENVRLASVDALKRFAAQDAVRRGAVTALERQTSPMVQIALIDFVVEAGLPDAGGTLRRLAQNDMVHEAVRARAEQGLRQVS